MTEPETSPAIRAPDPAAAEETKVDPKLSLPSEYYSMVVDSGPIIKHDARNLMGKAQSYVTTPSVLREIRDSKARAHLEHFVMPLLDLQVREPSDKAFQDIIAFAKQTGDYAGLSTVDLQVLALTLDLEREGNLVRGNTNLDHIRTTPKRKIGLGSIVAINGKGNNNNNNSKPSERPKGASLEEEKTGEESNQALDAQSEEKPKLLGREDYDVVEDSDDDDGSENEAADDPIEGQPQQPTFSTSASTPTDTTALPSTDPKPPIKKSWATLINNTATSTVAPEDPTSGLAFSSMSLKKSTNNDADVDDNGDSGGQFDDASDDEDEETKEGTNTEKELQLEFPSLLTASMVPFEGEDDEINEDGADNETSKAVDQNPHHRTRVSVFMTEEEMQQNLKPISKSGRKYNSFSKYKGLMKPKQPKKKPATVEEENPQEAALTINTVEPVSSTQVIATRFLGSGGGGETMIADDDDGLGWITSSDDIRHMKNEGGGRLDPGKTGPTDGNNNNKSSKAKGPPACQRTACATTDFAMQNVLLQMNLILLSTEGMRIRRLKSWVMRCGACFKIHGALDDFKDETNHHMKRLFCSHCGSDMMQRISASVDGKTGRLKLHFSKRKQGRHHSIRGTKFSLPKPGKGNKYKGDLLLREDQLLSGAWNQKVKINSGRKYQNSRSQSMFGRDIATSVGCNVQSTSSATFGGKGWASSANTSSNGGYGAMSDDIRVGFGARKNPNAAKGRERRGKKKKATDRACGMRRY